MQKNSEHQKMAPQKLIAARVTQEWNCHADEQMRTTR
jgi:hypothetical protein